MKFLVPARAKIRSQSEAARARTEAPPAPTMGVAGLHALYLDDVYRYCTRRLARREDAEDACAETFAAAFEGWPRFRGEVEVRLWLLGIARRKVADALRKQARRREIELAPDFDAPDASPHHSPPSAWQRAENRQAMRRLLTNLKDPQREALLLKYVEELSVEQIAVVMGRSKASVNSLLQRARERVFRDGKSYFLDSQTDSNPAQRGEL